jgi:hypothetical protein
MSVDEGASCLEKLMEMVGDVDIMNSQLHITNPILWCALIFKAQPYA